MSIFFLTLFFPFSISLFPLPFSLSFIQFYVFVLKRYASLTSFYIFQIYSIPEIRPNFSGSHTFSLTTISFRLAHRNVIT